jgi:hypothetical protein
MSKLKLNLTGEELSDVWALVDAVRKDSKWVQLPVTHVKKLLLDHQNVCRKFAQELDAK